MQPLSGIRVLEFTTNIASAATNTSNAPGTASWGKMPKTF